MCTSITQAFRHRRRNGKQSAAVVTILALCIGSCVAVFSMVQAVLLNGWMYADPGRIAVIWHARPNVPGNVGMSPSDLASYQSFLTSFDSVQAVTTGGFNLGGAPSPQRVTCARMTAGMFPLLGVAAQQGRWFTADEERDRTPVIVLSHRLLKAEFAGDPSAIGRDIVLDGMPRRIVAVMPEPFVFPPPGIQGLTPADCWIPASYTPVELAIPSFSHVVIARLARGRSWEQAAADAHAGAQRIWATYPAAVQSQVQLTARVVPLIEQATGRAWTPLALFAGAVIGLLLIGCANVSNLMLTSADRRRQEIAVRMSLGASRRTVIAQLLLESVGLALAGGVFGTVIAEGLLSAAIATNATAFPRLADARVDASALVVAVLCAIVAGALGGLTPACRVGEPSDAQSAHARTVSRGFAATWWSRGLIAFELALAVIVVIVAGVLARSVMSLNRVDVGLDTRATFSFTVALPEGKYRLGEQAASFRDGVVEALQRVPGIGKVAVSSATPVGEVIPGVVSPAGSASPADYRPAAVYSVSDTYVATLGIPLREGRLFEPTDRAPVAILSESLARQMAPQGSMVGRPIMMVGQAQPLTVIGVIGDVRQGGPSRPAAPAIYTPLWQAAQPVRTVHFIAQTDLPLSRLAEPVRRAVSGIDPEIPVFAVRTIADSVAATTAMQRFNMLVVGLFGAFAVVIALSGLYAVLAHSVEQARREFGIRQALGASRGRIIRAVLAQSLWPAGIGIAAGAVAATAASHLVASLLFEVKPNDPVTLASTVLLILCAAAASVTVPALRASRVDPATLLRHD